MSVNGKTETSAQAERLTREAMGLYEQGRLEEALLACEGALALDEKYTPALSLKGLIHERRGQISEAIAAYERVQAINPLSVSERARLEALRRQSRAAVRTASMRPLWQEALPAVLAFLGSGMILLIGLVLILRWTTPAPSPEPTRLAATTEPAAPRTVPTPPATPSPTTPETSPQNTNSQPLVPPVVVDPSRVALAPADTPPPPRGTIPTLPAPANSTSQSEPKPQPPSAPPKSSSDSDIMPDVKVEETQRGVYEIRVQRVGEGQNRTAATRATNDALTLAQNYQRAGNYREAIQAYLQALPDAPNPAEVHQQIATCYLRLGDKTSARAHFQQAIAEYERQIQAGRDVETARQGIAACQIGLQLCNE